MEFKLLRSFLAAARAQNISEAAHLLHLSQPSLSRQIMELEDSLGVRLFHRGNRRITLTDEGVLLRKRSGQILDLVRKTEEELACREETVSGTVYIGAGETHVFRGPAQSIKSLAEQYPDIRFHLFSGNAEDVTERLDKGLLDFGLLIEPADVAKYDYFRLQGLDVWGVLMRKDCPLAELDAVRPEDLWELPLVLSRQAMDGGHLARWLKREHGSLNVVATFNLIFNAALLVEAGVGYVLGLDNIINTTGNSRLCFRPLNPPLESNIVLVWKKYQVFSKAAELFLERVKAGRPE